MHSLSRRDFSRVFAASAPASSVWASQSPQARRPNILFILADDLGYGDVGFLNPESKIPTPNLDRLAKQGMRFTDAHSPSAVCTPTRYGLLTGRYCWRTRLQRGVLSSFGETLIEPGRLTVPSFLKSHGYDTAAVGKWHLGWNWPTTDGVPPVFKDAKWNVDFSRPATDGPTTRGFDYYFGTDVPNYPPFCFIENDHTVGKPTDTLPVEKYQNEKNPAFGALELRPGPMLRGWDFVEILPALTRRAVEYINKRDKSKPFFLYLPLTGPHTPVTPAPEFRGTTKVGPYGDFVRQVDWSVGQVLQALDRGGHTGNTLVIFTSDNGPERYCYEHARISGHYSMAPWRGVKRDLWEGGHRVPFVARWPGQIKPGTASGELTTHCDLLATIAAVLDVPLPGNAGEDSYNMLPALLGRKRSAPLRPSAVLHSWHGNFAVREGDWVLIDHPTGDNNVEPEWFQKKQGYRPHAFAGELYSLRQDPAQRNNLYSSRPEIVRRLKELLETCKREGRSPRSA